MYLIIIVIFVIGILVIGGIAGFFMYSQGMEDTTQEPIHVPELESDYLDLEPDSRPEPIPESIPEPEQLLCTGHKYCDGTPIPPEKSKTGSVVCASNRKVLRCNSINGVAEWKLTGARCTDNMPHACPQELPSVVGRTVQLIAGKKQCLNVSEIEVYGPDGKTNIAKGKKITQSSVHRQYPKRLLAKNLLDGNITNFALPDCATIGWFKIDLGKDTQITKVIVYNRLDERKRIETAKINIIDSNNKIVYTSNPIPPNFNLYTVNPPDKKIITSNVIPQSKSSILKCTGGKYCDSTLIPPEKSNYGNIICGAAGQYDCRLVEGVPKWYYLKKPCTSDMDHSCPQLPDNIDRVPGYSGTKILTPGARNQSMESCRQLALKSNGKYVAWGFRTNNHSKARSRRTCFLYHPGFKPYAGNPNTNALVTGCLNPGEKVTLGCKK